MALEDSKMEELKPDIYQDLLVVEDTTHFTVGPVHNMVILQTKDMSKERVEKALQDAIQQAFRVAGREIELAFSERKGAMLYKSFYMNYTTKYDPQRNRRIPKGLCFVWFDSVELANIFLGKNPDGTPRIELQPNPAYIPDTWDNKEEEKEAFTADNGWGGDVFTGNWADIAEEIVIPEFLEIPLPPLVTIMGFSNLEDIRGAFPIDVEAGYAKVKKEGFEGKSLSRLHVFCPDWVDLIELRTLFSRVSSYTSYPILEYYADRGNGHLYVSFAPGSKDAAIANVLFFNYHYTRGKESVDFRMDYAKDADYYSIANRPGLVIISQKTYESFQNSRKPYVPSQQGKGATKAPQKGKSPSYNKEGFSSSRAPSGNWERSPNKPPPSSSSSSSRPTPPSSSSSSRPPPSSSSSSRPPPPSSSSSSSRPPASKPPPSRKPAVSKPPAKSGSSSMFSMLGEE